MSLVAITLCALMLCASIALCVVTIRKARQWRDDITDYYDLRGEVLRLKLELATERGEVRF